MLLLHLHILIFLVAGRGGAAGPEKGLFSLIKSYIVNEPYHKYTQSLAKHGPNQ